MIPKPMTRLEKWRDLCKMGRDHDLDEMSAWRRWHYQEMRTFYKCLRCGTWVSPYKREWIL